MALIDINDQQPLEMASVTELKAIAREHSTMLRRFLARHKQKEIALDIGVSESKISHFVTGDGGLSLDEVGYLIATLQIRDGKMFIDPKHDGIIVKKKLWNAVLTALHEFMPHADEE